MLLFLGWCRFDSTSGLLWVGDAFGVPMICDLFDANIGAGSKTVVLSPSLYRFPLFASASRSPAQWATASRSVDTRLVVSI